MAVFPHLSWFTTSQGSCGKPYDTTTDYDGNNPVPELYIAASVILQPVTETENNFFSTYPH